MNIVEQNIVKFVDSLIVDDFSTAHKFLENVINQKIKVIISEEARKKLFNKGKKGETSNLKPFKKKKRNKKDEENAANNSAFGGEKFPIAKPKNLKESVGSETINLRSILDSDLYSKMRELFRRSCHGGKTNKKFMEIAYTIGKVDMDHWGNLLEEIEECITSCKDTSDKAYLTEIKEKIKEAGTKMYEEQEEFERDMPRYNTETLGDEINIR